MTRLDDARMHRAHRHLVHLRTAHLKERYVLDRFPAVREAHRFQPGMTFRKDAVLLVNLALEVMRRRAIRRQRAIRAIEWRGGDPYLAVYVVGQGRQQVR